MQRPAIKKGDGPSMARKIAYWVTTGLIALMSLFGAFTYLSASPEAVAGFAHVGYPQQLRVLLGVAKLAGGIALVAPGFPLLKEWAYAGFAFAWIAASIAHYLAGDKPEFLMPVFLLVVLAISYVTRPGDRRLSPRPVTMA
jgi:DoxX-like protein